MIPVPPPPDLRAGLLVYATSGRRREARIRSEIEDFRVEELIDLGAAGPIPVYRVEKRGLNTLEAAAVMGRVLGKRVSYAGLKDKKGVTVQYMGPTGALHSAPAEIQETGLRASLVGRFASPVRRGALLGNRFGVILRDPQQGLAESVEQVYGACTSGRVPNFFGYQRFGLKGDTNRRVGKAIVARDFAAAVGIMVGDPREGEAEEAAEARRLFAAGEYTRARELFRLLRMHEAAVVDRLVAGGGDALRALRAVPIPLRRLFVNSYQSYVFNRVLSRAVSEQLDIGRAVMGDNWVEVREDGLRVGKVHGVRETPTQASLPACQVVGYAFRDYGSRLDRILVQELEEESMEPRMFYVKEAEEMSSEGGFRHAPLLLRAARQTARADGALLEFTLSRGEYATTLLREVVKPADPVGQGF